MQVRVLFHAPINVTGEYNVKKQKFFFGEMTGLNADISRHREMEKKLREDIEDYEKRGDERMTKTYRHFLNLLLASKAEVVSGIGKK